MANCRIGLPFSNASPARPLALAIAMLLSACLLGGCGGLCIEKPFVTDQRVDVGLVVVLPGIDVISGGAENIREGLYKAGLPQAIVIYRWGVRIPLVALLINETDVQHNRLEAGRAADKIVEYQRSHPGKPIFLVGHSAGGAVAVFILESMAGIKDARPIEGAFLLSSSISADYDLTQALTMTRRGVVNISNSGDTAMLGSGTQTFGNVDGGHGDSAGRTGFCRRYDKLFERPITDEEVRGAVPASESTHFLTTNEHLIQRYAPAWITSDRWPIPRQAPPKR